MHLALDSSIKKRSESFDPNSIRIVSQSSNEPSNQIGSQRSGTKHRRVVVRKYLRDNTSENMSETGPQIGLHIPTPQAHNTQTFQNELDNYKLCQTFGQPKVFNAQNINIDVNSPVRPQTSSSAATNKIRVFHPASLRPTQQANASTLQCKKKNKILQQGHLIQNQKKVLLGSIKTPTEAQQFKTKILASEIAIYHTLIDDHFMPKGGFHRKSFTASGLQRQNTKSP